MLRMLYVWFLTNFCLLDAYDTLEYLKLRILGPKHELCRSGLMKVCLSEKISLKRDLNRMYSGHFAWTSLEPRLSEIHQDNSFLKILCGSTESCEAFPINLL